MNHVLVEKHGSSPSAEGAFKCLFGFVLRATIGFSRKRPDRARNPRLLAGGTRNVELSLRQWRQTETCFLRSRPEARVLTKAKLPYSESFCSLTKSAKSDQLMMNFELLRRCTPKTFFVKP